MNCHACTKPYIDWDEYLQCIACSHVFRSPPVDAEEFHAGAYRKKVRRNKKEFSPDGKLLPKFHEVRHSIVKGRLAKINEWIKKSDKVFDVGGGAGTFARVLKPLVMSVECCELDPLLVAECQRLGFKTERASFFDLNERPNQYDIVSAWHVLEHVPDIYGFVNKMIDFSRRIVILEVPTDRPVANSYSGDGHCHYFSRQSFPIFLDHFPIQYEIIEGVQAPSMLAICQV